MKQRERGRALESVLLGFREISVFTLRSLPFGRAGGLYRLHWPTHFRCNLKLTPKISQFSKGSAFQ